MKNRFIILFVFLNLFTNIDSDAQILCIQCYNQNDSISSNVNNLISNGGFENGCGVTEYFCPTSAGYNCNITNWTCVGGGINTYAQIADSLYYTNIVEGSKAAYFGNQYSKPCSSTLDDTSCIINMGCIVSNIPAGYPIHNSVGYGGSNGVSLKQTVAGLVVGNTYVLEFWVGGENALFNGLFAVNIDFGNTFLSNKPTYGAAAIGTRYIIQFKATSTSHTIQFTNWGHICYYCTELVLDNVRLYSIEELANQVPHCTLDISEINEQNNISVIPNPSEGIFTIEQYKAIKTEIEIYNLLGELIYTVESEDKRTTIDLTKQPKGIYFVKVIGINRNAASTKIVIK